MINNIINLNKKVILTYNKKKIKNTIAFRIE